MLGRCSDDWGEGLGTGAESSVVDATSGDAETGNGSARHAAFAVAFQDWCKMFYLVVRVKFATRVCNSVETFFSSFTMSHSCLFCSCKGRA